MQTNKIGTDGLDTYSIINNMSGKFVKVDDDNMLIPIT